MGCAIEVRHGDTDGAYDVFASYGTIGAPAEFGRFEEVTPGSREAAAWLRARLRQQAADLLKLAELVPEDGAAGEWDTPEGT